MNTVEPTFCALRCRDAPALVLQRIGLVDLDPDRAREDHVEQILRHRHQIVAFFRIGGERRPGEEQRAFLREDAEVDGPIGPEAWPKLTIRPFGLRQSSDFMNVSLPTECRPPTFPPLVISFDPRDEILARVDDRMLAAVGRGDLRLLLVAHRADDGRALQFRPLTGDQADASGRRVEQDDIAVADPVNLTNEILHGQALSIIAAACGSEMPSGNGIGGRLA